MSNPKFALVFSLVLAVVAGAAGKFVWHSNSPGPNHASVVVADPVEQKETPHKLDEGRSPQADEDLDKLKTDLLQIEAQLAALQYEQEKQANAISLPNQNTLVEAKEIPTPEQADSQVEQQVQRRQSLYDAQLMSEAVDMEWADETLAQVETALTGDDFKGLDFVEGNCGSTLCRVKLNANQNVPMEESMQRLSVDRPWDGPTFVSIDSMGNVSLFFARDGYELPTDEVL